MPDFIKNNKLGEAHYGHRGRPGQRGGSLPSKSMGGFSPETTKMLTAKNKEYKSSLGSSYSFNTVVNPDTIPNALFEDNGVFLYVPATKSTIIGLGYGMAHADIAHSLIPSSNPDHAKLLDKSVHGYASTRSYFKRAMNFDVEYAGATEYNSSNGKWEVNEDKALKNIYKTMEHLVKSGVPAQTAVVITTSSGRISALLGEAYHLKILNSREITIAEAKRIISSKLPNLDSDQRKIYDAHAWTPKVDLKRIKDAILKERIRVAEAQITNLLNSVGCAKQIGRLTNTGIYDILASESEKDALSIVNTRNYELVNLILNTGYPTASDIKSWDSKRAGWKGQQVGTWTVGSTRHFISEEFFARNSKYLKDTDGTAILVGKNPAAEPICQGWLNRGRVPIKEALQSKWPPHIGCVHVWEFEPKKVTFFKRRGVCPLLWRGE